MAETRIGIENRRIIYLAIPRLVRNCILGIDPLREFNFTINLYEEKIIMKTIERETHLQYSGGMCKIKNIEEKEVFRIEENSDDVEEDFSEDEDTEEGTEFKERMTYNITWNRLQSLPEVSESPSTKRIKGSMNQHKDAYQLTIDEKLQRCTANKPSTVEALRSLLWDYHDVFYKKPGRIKKFEYELRV